MNKIFLLIIFALTGCDILVTESTGIENRKVCNHSISELSKIPFGPTGTEDYLIKLDDSEKEDAGFNFYMGMYSWGSDGLGKLEGWVSPDGLEQGNFDFVRASPEKIAVMERLKNEYEKLPTVTYVYCDGTLDTVDSVETNRNPMRYNYKYPIALRATHYYGKDMIFLYFEDEKCNRIYKTPSENLGNIVLREVCRQLNPEEKEPMYSAS